MSSENGRAVMGPGDLGRCYLGPMGESFEIVGISHWKSFLCHLKQNFSNFLTTTYSINKKYILHRDLVYIYIYFIELKWVTGNNICPERRQCTLIFLFSFISLKKKVGSSLNVNHAL